MKSRPAAPPPGGPSAAKIARYYRGAVAEGYEAARADRPLWRAEEAALALLLEGAAGRVLDVPLGTGRFLPLYRRLGLAVVGRDVSADMLAQARARHGEGDFAVGDILALDLPARAVETAVCVRLLNLLAEAEMVRALGELQRVAASRILLTLRSAPKRRWRPGKRGQTQRHEAFLDALDGWRIDRSEALLSEGYRLYRLVPCDA